MIQMPTETVANKMKVLRRGRRGTGGLMGE